MKKSVFVTFGLVFALLFAGNAAAQKKYATYANSRYGYSIEYPSDLLKGEGESDAGDGQIFRSKDRSIELFVWGQYNALGHTIEDEFKLDQRKRKQIAYKRLFSDGYVMSRTEGKKIYYTKVMLLGKDGDTGATFASFVMSYPASQKGKFDRIVKRVAASFKFQ